MAMTALEALPCAVMSAYHPALFRPYVVYAIVAINVLVFVMWYTAPLLFMVDNFLVSWQHVAEGRLWVLITAVFSHNLLFHLLINMIVLWSFGSLLEQLMGRRGFLSFYLVAGIVSSLAHAGTSTLLLNRPPDAAALGASGAVAGLLLLFAMTFPRHRILVFGVVPVPALVGALAFIAVDLWGLFAQFEGGGLPIGHGAHLGGAFTGIAYYLLLRARASR
jgi:membrane associated rhomboid family serine protease